MFLPQKLSASLFAGSALTLLSASIPALGQTPPVAPPAAANAAPPRDPQSSFEPRSGPGEGQKIMEKMVGEWTVVKSIFPVGKPPVRTSGTCRQMMVEEGRFLHSQFVFDSPTGKTTGVGILGFDPKTGLFTSVWIDSRSTAFSMRQSEGTFNGETVELYGKSLDEKAPARRSRTIAKLEENGRLLIHQQFVPTPDGKERVVMELRMTRVPDAPAKPAAKPSTKPVVKPALTKRSA